MTPESSKEILHPLNKNKTRTITRVLGIKILFSRSDRFSERIMKTKLRLSQKVKQ